MSEYRTATPAELARDAKLRAAIDHTQMKEPGAVTSGSRASELYRDAGDSENDTTSNA
jgi:hypothetical protein